MPLDKSGKFHGNVQRAMGADKHASKPPAGHASSMSPTTEDGAAHESDGGSHTTLHDHGDGTFHTEGHDGEKTEHPHIGHALAHMAGKHGGGSKHMNIHADGMGGHTSHHVAEDGKVQGPHDTGNLEELKSSMDNFLNEEGSEYGGKGLGGHAGSDGGY